MLDQLLQPPAFGRPAEQQQDHTAEQPERQQRAPTQARQFAGQDRHGDAGWRQQRHQGKTAQRGHHHAASAFAALAIGVGPACEVVFQRSADQVEHAETEHRADREGAHQVTGVEPGPRPGQKDPMQFAELFETPDQAMHQAQRTDEGAVIGRRRQHARRLLPVRHARQQPITEHHQGDQPEPLRIGHQRTPVPNEEQHQQSAAGDAERL